jgi:hypothetical protein
MNVCRDVPNGRKRQSFAYFYKHYVSYELINKVTPWTKNHLGKLITAQLVKKFSLFCAAHVLITVFTV